MAFTQRDNNTDTGAGTTQSRTSASFTPTAGSIVVVCGGLQGYGANLPSWTISDTLGSTWNSIGVLNDTANSATFQGSAAVWWALAGTGARTVTVDPYTGTDVGWVSIEVFDVDSVNTTSPFNQTVATNKASTLGASNTAAATTTLGAAAASGNQCALICHTQNDTAGAATVPSGWTSLVNPTTTSDKIFVFTNTTFTSTAMTVSPVGSGINYWMSYLIEFAPVGGVYVPNNITVSRAAVNRASRY